jgi:hydroxymethylpyrimidine/phosphomethylpyrimidine kinase
VSVRPPSYSEGMPPVALTIAGSDPSGGAGIQADLKTFHQFEVYGEAVITLITVQNTRDVLRVECLDPALVADQLKAVLEDIPPDAAKTGALGDRAIVEVVAKAAERFRFPLIVDPVMVSKHGRMLLSEKARDAMASKLLPCAALVTPNVPEAAALTGIRIENIDDMRRAARALCESLGARAALVTGGHLGDDATDVLFCEGDFVLFPAQRIDTPHTHGTGCTVSAAITAEVARGTDLKAAVACAKAFITEAIRSSPGLGHGAGPVNHHAWLAARGAGNT